MKVVILGDCHVGARNDHAAFHDFFEKFFTKQLFPYMLDNDIKTIVQLGDLFDRRRYVNFLSLHRSRKYLFDPIRDNGLEMYMICGNHDVYHKSSLTVNSPELLLGEYRHCVTIYSSPGELMLGDLKVAMLPWICSGNHDESMRFIQETDAQVLFGHLEINGFEMYRGVPCEDGFSRSTFEKFDMVMTGHYHHKSHYGNIYYLGTPYEITWSDWNDPRGFHVFDTDTRELEFIQNDYRMFNKVHYDDSQCTMEDLLDVDFKALSGHMVKLIVVNKTNPYWFDVFLKKIEEAGVLDVQIVEDNIHLDLDDVEEIGEDIEDTITILSKYSEQFKDRVDVKKLNGFLQELYQEALSIE